MSRLAVGPTQPPFQWVLGAFSLGDKVVKAWSWPLTSIFMEWYLVKLRDNFTFYLTASACCLPFCMQTVTWLNADWTAWWHISTGMLAVMSVMSRFCDFSAETWSFVIPHNQMLQGVNVVRSHRPGKYDVLLVVTFLKWYIYIVPISNSIVMFTHFTTSMGGSLVWEENLNVRISVTDSLLSFDYGWWHRMAFLQQSQKIFMTYSSIQQMLPPACW